MARSQALEVQEKKEQVSKEEKTVPARYFIPNTDIYETEDALTVVMEVPGVAKQAIDVSVENEVLRVEARIDSANTKGSSQFTRSTTSGTSRAPLPCRTKSISRKLVRSLGMAC